MVDRVSGRGPVDPPQVKRNNQSAKADFGKELSRVASEKGGKIPPATPPADSLQVQGKEDPATAALRPGLFYHRPESREEKILRIKQAIDAGTYSVPSQEVADKLIKIMKDPQLVRFFANKDEEETKIRRQEEKLLPQLTKDQQKHYLDLVKKIEGEVTLDSEDVKFLREIRNLMGKS